MDTLVTAVLVLSILTAAHERFVEALRGAFADSSIPALRGLASAAIGPVGNAVLAIVMALVTHADLFLLFTPKSSAPGAAFFAGYLTWSSANGEASGSLARQFGGCILMGACAALGSKFWHDLASGLVDLRAAARSLPGEAAKELAAAPSSPPAKAVVAV